MGTKGGPTQGDNRVVCAGGVAAQMLALVQTLRAGQVCLGHAEGGLRLQEGLHLRLCVGQCALWHSRLQAGRWWAGGQVGEQTFGENCSKHLARITAVADEQQMLLRTM